MEMGCEELNLSVKAFKKHAECNHYYNAAADLHKAQLSS